MAEARAKLDLDASGLEKGAQQCVAAYRQFIHADQQARTQLRKPTEGARSFEDYLQREGKVRHSIMGLAQTLTSGASATDILSESAIRLSETFKTGLGVAVGVSVVSVLAKRVSEAAEQVELLDDKLEKLGTPQGNIQFQTLDQLQSRLKELRDFQKENQGADPNRSPMKALGQGFGDVVGGLGNNAAALVMGGEMKSFDEIVNAREIRNSETSRLIEDQKSKVAQKTDQTFAIERERNSGSQAEADRMAVRSKFSELIGGAKDNPELIKVLKRAESEATDSANAKHFGPAEDVFRQRRLQDLQSSDQASDVNVAKVNLDSARTIEFLTAKRSEEERAIAEIKTKSAEIALRNAERENQIQYDTGRNAIDSLRDRITGHTRLADIRDRAFKTEQEAVKAERSGHPEIAGMVRVRGNLEQESQDFEEAFNPKGGSRGNGGLFSMHDRLRNMRNRIRGERAQGNAAAEFERSGGLLDVQRDSDGNIISGIDPNTGERRAPNSRENQRMSRQATIDADRKDSSGQPLHGRAGALAEALGFFNHSAKKEMTHAQAKVEAKEESMSAKDQAQDQSTKNLADIKSGIESISKTLGGWN